MAPAQRVASLFSAVTSAMQPARFPLALLAVLFISALAPLVDLAGGSKFGPRGFSAGALTESEQALDEQRARSAARRFAGPEVAELESIPAGSEGLAPEPSLSQLAGAVRQAASSAKPAGKAVRQAALVTCSRTTRSATSRASGE